MVWTGCCNLRNAALKRKTPSDRVQAEGFFIRGKGSLKGERRREKTSPRDRSSRREEKEGERGKRERKKEKGGGGQG
ncbi:hypothetical protein ACQP3D_28605, partial [Escherichia coli]